MTGGEADAIGGFDAAPGDRVLPARPAPLLADGSVDGTRLRTADTGGGAFRLFADLDGDGGFAKLLTIQDAAGLELGEVLANAVDVA